MARTPPDRPADADKARLRVLQSTLSKMAVEGLAREVLQHMAGHAPKDQTAERANVLALCRALRAPHPYAARAQVDALVARGLTLEVIFRDYLAAASVELGRQWDASAVKFTEVSIALARIHAILDDLRLRFPLPPTNRPRRIAFAAVPGEQHRLGVDMATDLFRREGWDVTHLVDADHDGILNSMADTDIVLLGLSAATKASLAALVRLVLALRARRPDLRILISGRLATDREALLTTLGVDAVVADVPQALAAVADLVGRPPR